jgi:hypothetical protein
MIKLFFRVLPVLVDVLFAVVLTINIYSWFTNKRPDDKEIESDE